MKKALRARELAATGRPQPGRTKSSSVGDKSNGTHGRPDKAARARGIENPENILHSSGIATVFFDRDLKLRFFTPAATSLFRMTVTDLGRPLAQVKRRFADDDLVVDAQTAIATGVSLWREVKADGGAWYNRRLLPYRADDDDIQGVVMTFADISEMKATELEVEAARAYSNSIIDTIRQPLVVLDHDLRIVSASPSFYRSFAVMPANAVGRQLPNLRDRCFDVQAMRSFLDRIAAGHDVSEEYEIEIELPSRGRRVLQLNAREIPAVPPQKRRTLLAIDDITDRKNAEAVIETAKKQAERANLGKSRFLAAASHDLRQPLQTIALLQGILATKIKQPDVMKLITRIGDSVDVMSGILNKLLDINQLEAGIMSPELTNFPIAVLLERLHSEFADQAATKGLSYHVVSGRQSVRSDPTLLELMIRNLVSNALKYTNRGKILLGCRRHGDRLRIEIWDTGIGIPEGQIKAIFEEFFQIDNPARERTRGLGLGLSIVQRLGDLLGHAIEVRSRHGEGSVFSIEVPTVDTGSAIEPRAGTQLPAKRIGEGESILVIEDDPSIRDALRLLFEANGYRAAVAADGKSALQLVANGGTRPRVVVADYNLPNGLSGLDVAARLRATFDSALPILIVTGDISTETVRAIAAAGCIQLSKPIKVEELTSLVRLQLAAPRPNSERSLKDEPAASAAAKVSSTVFLIDDDDALRDTMREIIEQDGRSVEAFATGESFLEAYRPGRPGCLLVDARLPGLGGLGVLQLLKVEHHDLPAIMITGYGEVSMAVEAMKAGAIDFIEKPFRRDDLLASIDRALELARDSMALTTLREATAARIAALTPRERQIMDLVIAGQPNKIIAADLKVSQRTVENHRAAVMKKTRSKSLSDLVRLAITVE
jgi:two-component system, chemotaxis family, CheB/CheR fusion protein